MSEPDPLIGTSLAHYEIIDLLGRGGMATVYKARHVAFNRIVAIKVLPRILLHDESFMQRFRREAEVIARLEHFHILPVYDSGEHESMPYIVMRYLDGGSVRDRIQSGPLPWQDVVRITSQVADALDYAHARNVIHRDVKPSNILLDTAGNAYLADFGIAKMSEGTSSLTASGIVGTPAYMAPEQSESGTPRPSMDIYALGASVFEMLIGQVPYTADTPIAQILKHLQNPVPSLLDHNPDFPVEVDVVVQRALAKSPADRYQSAGEFAYALQSALTSVGEEEWVPETRLDVPLHTLRDVAASVPPTYEDLASAEAPSTKHAAAPRAPSRRGKTFGLWFGVGLVALGLLAVMAIILIGLLGSRWIGGMGAGQPAATAAQGVAPLPDTPIPAPTETTMPSLTDTPVPGTQLPVELPTSTAEPSPTSAPTALPPTVFKHGVEMVIVPAGSFVMGYNEGYANERPEHEVYLDAFYIDLTEVTNRDYQACVEAVDANHCPPRGLDDIGSPSRFKYYGLEAYNDYPVILVSWDEAQTYCKWRGGHLPTEAQWEKAARWDPETGENYLFPWGTGSLDPYYLNYDSNFGDTTRVKNYPGGVSPVGAFDMAGNVAEWVFDWYRDNYYEMSPYENPVGPETGEFRVLRGGSYESKGSDLTTPSRELMKPATKLQTLGFRCAWTPSGDPTFP